MVNTWITPICNRTYADVQEAMAKPDISHTIGAYNDFDPNRVENNTAYVLEYMLEHKIIRAAPAMRIKTNWQEDEIIVASEMKRIVENVAVLCSLSNPLIRSDLPELHLATQMNYVLANDIERALDIMHDQPELPLNYFQLKLNNGLILSVDRLDGTSETINSDVCLMAEDEIAHITAVAPEPDAQYKVFTNWSGNTDDLQYIDNVTDATTTYTGQYHDVEFTANFKTELPRTVTLTNAYISLNGDDHAESGPRSGVYRAGDNIMIIADVAPAGKAFYCWEGTQEALDAISVSELDPSTVWLAMPDCDVRLWPKYINAGQHYVQVTNGTGSGWYNYKDTVSISATVPANYGFDNWSGNTQYLTDIYSSSISFEMPDVDVSLRANYSYRYGYYNVQIINGLINGETTVSNARESSSLPLTPTPPSDRYGIDYWEVEGAGSASLSYFTVGRGNAIITGHYAPIYTLTVYNIDNNGETVLTRDAVSGHYFGEISTSTVINHYYFRYWEENGEPLSPNRIINLVATGDRTITAVYEYVEPTYYSLTMINRNNSGETEVLYPHAGGVCRPTSIVSVDNYMLEGMYFNGEYIEVNPYLSSFTYEFRITQDTTVEFVYRTKRSYYLTVEDGVITETGSHSGRFLERERIDLTTDPPGPRQAVPYWHTTEGRVYAMGGGPETAYVIMGSEDATVGPVYVNKVYVDVVTYSGTTTYDMLPGNSIQVVGTPSPELYELDQWMLNYGDANIGSPYSNYTYIYAGSNDSEVEMNYKAIPWYQITVINGYVEIDGQWITNGEVIRNSNPYIKMKPAPEGHQFLQWEIIQGSQNDVYQPMAETTTLRNVLHNITVRATYYIPDPEVKYTLTVTQKDGTIETYNNPVGTQVNIHAQSPDEGYRFYRWNGDYQYLVGGRYASENVVNMPAKNITLQPTYAREGYVTLYHLYMYSAECLVSDDGEGHQIWATDGEFEEGERVRIRATNIPFGWKFNGWEGTDSEQTALVNDRFDEDTFLTMGEFDVYMSATIIEENKFTMKITNGQTSGEYYGDARVDVYFDKENTDTEHYSFVRWTGDVEYLSLYDGGAFDVTKPGTSNEPQYVRMPFRRIEITGEYTAAYKVKINGGHIDGTEDEYFAEGTVLNIVADVGEGMIFQRWEGNVDGIGDIYDPTTTLTTGNAAKEITAVYTSTSDRNGIGYGLTSFVSNDTINISDITVVSGEIMRGFIVTDSRGHFYVVTSVNEETVSVLRLSKIYKGGNTYE